MNLALEKERVTKGGKARGEIGKVTGMCLPCIVWAKNLECLVEGSWKNGGTAGG